ncbi:hypothetical protein Pelo_3420 [Pelomyxa schiedti]|nr:hypothetical protein Pelo_3420 [Pelomyxa schiedti]
MARPGRTALWGSVFVVLCAVHYGTGSQVHAEEEAPQTTIMGHPPVTSRAQAHPTIAALLTAFIFCFRAFEYILTIGATGGSPSKCFESAFNRAYSWTWKVLKPQAPVDCIILLIFGPFMVSYACAFFVFCDAVLHTALVSVCLLLVHIFLPSFFFPVLHFGSAACVLRLLMAANKMQKKGKK